MDNRNCLLGFDTSIALLANGVKSRRTGGCEPRNVVRIVQIFVCNFLQNWVTKPVPGYMPFESHQ